MGTEVVLTESDVLEYSMDRARESGDHARMQRLYQRQQGTENAYGVEGDADDTEEIDYAPSSLDGYTPWDDLDADAQDSQFNSVMARSDPDTALAELEAAYPGASLSQSKIFTGDMLDQNPHSPGFIAALEAVGVVDHPDVFKFLAHEARRESLNSRKGNAPMRHDYDATSAVDALQEQIELAQRRGEHSKANSLYQLQQDAYRAMPGGSDSVVGGGGRTT